MFDFSNDKITLTFAGEAGEFFRELLTLNTKYSTKCPENFFWF